MKKLTQYFFEGLIFTAPIALTAYVLYKVFYLVDGWLNLPFPGAGVAVTLVAVTVTGFLASNFITRKVIHGIELLMTRLPFVKLLHAAVRDVMTAFVGEKRRFDKPVLVEVMPGSGVRAIGFMTRDSLEQLDLRDQVAVYFPQSFNFAGNLLIYPRNQVTPLSVEGSRLMAFVVSGGVTL